LAGNVIGGDTRQEVENELSARNTLKNQDIGDAAKNPLFWERNAKAALKGPSQLINGIVNGLPGLAAMGIGGLGSETFEAIGETQLGDFAERNQIINNNFGSSDPIRAEESIGESLTGALVPGGFFAKLIGVGVDSAVDQTVRELTDTQATDYNTVFDRMGITNDGEAPALGPLAAIGTGLVLGGVGIAGINKLVTKKQAIAIARPLRDLDPAGPPDLFSIERASDLTRANLADEQGALTTMLERAGIANFDEISKRIEFDTHTAAHSRAQEALRTGKLTTLNSTFDTPIPPTVLYQGYQNLAPAVKKDTADYINLLDMLDDAKIAQAANVPGNHGQTIAILNRQIAAIAQRSPLSVQMSRDYRTVTSSVRDFLEGGLFSSKFRQQLDIERPNYVPLEISNVDQGAPFLQRMKQAQSDEAIGAGSDWFLQKRNSAGNYDLNRRADPFDMLIDYSEAALLSRMKNDTKVAAVDALLSSGVGKQTIRLVREGEAELYPNRLVTILRNGEKETYITPKLQAALLKFDPYIAKYPTLFAIKRLSETAMVGPLSITFAPTTMIRDAVGGMVTRPTGLMTGSLMQVAAAIPKMTWAKAKGQIARSWQAKLAVGQTALPEGIMSKAAQQQFADNMANSYINSIYHQMNTSGGFDASLMANKINAGSETFKELKRSIITSRIIDNPLVNNMVTRFGANTVGNMLEGFVTLFNTMQDAPRFAAIENTIKKTGMGTDEATRLGKQLTGDASKSGRVYGPDGIRMDVDAIDQGVLNLINKPLGAVTEVIRETTPFFNPMVQGLTRFKNAFAEDPIGTNLRAWKTIGIPAVAAYGWNEMLGSEYNDYAMDRRASRDVAMSMYVGVPGLPPEQGIEIPIMHELLFYGAPFTRSLHGFARSEDPEMTSKAMQILSREMLSNSLDIGFPVAGAAMANLVGVNGPDSLLRPTEGVYSIKENQLGFLPQNAEAIIRTLFSSAGDTAIDLAYSMTQPDGEYDFAGFMETVTNNVTSRAPIVKNLAGKKTANIAFSMPMKIKADKYKAYADARKFFDEFYNPKRATENDFDLPSSYGKFKNVEPYPNADDINDLPYMMPGPERLVKPTNPYIGLFGQQLADEIGSNTLGMSGLVDRERTYSKYVEQLRGYGPADQVKIKTWFDRLTTLDGLDDDETAMKELLLTHKIDLTDFDSRVKLINIIENERSNAIAAQLNVIAQVEDSLTEQLRVNGVLGPDEEFDITKHLKPYDADPFKQGVPATDGQP
jgi:hypothetical protein